MLPVPQIDQRPVALYLDPRDVARACMWQALPALDVVPVGSIEQAERALFSPLVRRRRGDQPLNGRALGASMVLVRLDPGERQAFRWVQELAVRGFEGARVAVLDAGDSRASRARAAGLEVVTWPTTGFALREHVYGCVGVSHDGLPVGGYDPSRAVPWDEPGRDRPCIEDEDEDVLLLALEHPELTAEELRLVVFAGRTATQRELADALGISIGSVKDAAARVLKRTEVAAQVLSHRLGRAARLRARANLANLAAMRSDVEAELPPLRRDETGVRPRT